MSEEIKDIAARVLAHEFTAEAVNGCAVNMLQSNLDRQRHPLQTDLETALRGIVEKVIRKVVDNPDHFPPVQCGSRWKFRFGDDISAWVVREERFWADEIPGLCQQFAPLSRNASWDAFMVMWLSRLVHHTACATRLLVAGRTINMMKLNEDERFECEDRHVKALEATGKAVEMVCPGIDN